MSNIYNIECVQKSDNYYFSDLRCHCGLFLCMHICVPVILGIHSR